MPRRQASPCHVRRPRCRSPLISVECGWMKHFSRRRRITPFAILKGRHVEVHEHAESQIYKPLLQIQKRPSTTPRRPASFVRFSSLFSSYYLTTGKHRGRGGLGGEAKEISSGRHIGSSTPRGQLAKGLSLPTHENHCIPRKPPVTLIHRALYRTPSPSGVESPFSRTWQFRPQILHFSRVIRAAKRRRP
jgi:hypothetical protein